MAVNGNTFTMADNNTETFTALCGQLAGLIRSASTDFEDIVASSLINPWAKYKPFRYNAWNFASDSARDAARKSVNQGFDITGAKICENGLIPYSSMDSYFTPDMMNGWVYLHPRGGTYNEPNRMRDFDGYNHGALPFIGGFSIPSRWSLEADNFNVAFRITVTGDGVKDPDYITHLDFPFLENAYMGIALVGPNGNNYRMTSEETIGSGVVSFNVPTSRLVKGAYTAYPFFSTKKLSFNDGGIVVSEQYAVPNTVKANMELVDSYINISAQGTYREAISAPYYLDYTIVVYNYSSEARTFSNNEVRLRYANKTWNDALLNDEKSRSVSTFTVPAGGSYTISGFFSAIVQELYNNSKLWISIGTGAYQQSVVPMRPISPM